MKKIIYWIVAIAVVGCLGLYALNALAAGIHDPERCSSKLISDFHPDHRDPLHYDHSCVMEPNPEYVGPAPTPAEVQAPGPAGSGESHTAAPQPAARVLAVSSLKSGLTAPQVAAIIALLEAFGVDPVVVGTVAVILYGDQ